MRHALEEPTQRGPRPKVLLAIQQASARYAVPSNVTGKRPDPESAAAA
jgi:hypothetical protein